MEATLSHSAPQHLAQYALLVLSGGQASVSLPGSEKCAPDGEALQPGAEVRGAPRLLRCRRRPRAPGDFAGGYPSVQHFVASVSRRNERERNRVRMVNAGFQTLRQHVPSGASSGKLSKVETLRSAVEYIRALEQLLGERDHRSPARTGTSAGPGSPRSPCSTCSTFSEDGAACGHLSPEEPQLLDFSTWFHRY